MLNKSTRIISVDNSFPQATESHKTHVLAPVKAERFSEGKAAKNLIRRFGSSIS